VLHVGSTEVTEVSEPERTLMEILARNVEAALDRAERERGLKRRQARLERQNERLERLSNTLSHDLRNPLQVARSHLELLDDAVQSGRIDDIERMLDRMDQLIDDAMSLARTDGDVGGTEPVSLTAVAEEACAGVETGTADVTVHEMATVQADRSRLLELFENLLRNAVEHGSPSPESRGQQDTVEGIRGVTVEIGPLEDGFYIADDGRGIPESEREAVFEYGYSTADDGTGFGLSIVREIAESHGWTVSVTGSEAGGARFEITGVESTGR
jgi:signal transduction histidine kinase